MLRSRKFYRRRGTCKHAEGRCYNFEGQNSTPALPASYVSTVPMVMKPLEAVLVLRVLVDRSVIEAFAQRGRVSTTRRVYPSRADSNGAALFYKAPTSGMQTPSPKVEMTIWEMGNAFHAEG